MEVFYSIQGEGYHSGKAACFIRLGGCDVGCHWCDVKESWDIREHPLMDVVDISQKAAATKCQLAVVTGGEPTMHNLDLLTSELKKRGINTGHRLEAALGNSCRKRNGMLLTDTNVVKTLR